MDTIGKDDVSFDGRSFRITAEGYGSVYEIEAFRLKSYEDCVKWMAHLAEKTWFTTKLARMFLNTFGMATRLNVYGL